MDLLYYGLTILLLLVNSAIGAFVIARNPRNHVNRVFASIILFISLWVLVNFLADNSKIYPVALIFTKLTFVTTAFFAWSLLLFVLIFPQSNRRLSSFINLLLFMPNLLVCLLMLNDSIVSGVEIQSWGVNVIFGQMNWVFAIYFLGYILTSFAVLIRKLVASKGTVRMQIIYVLLGLASTTILASITNLVIPFILNSFYPSKYGHYFTIFFIVFTSYAITKARLMDISVVISRTAAHILTVMLLGVVYLGFVLSYRTYISVKIDLGLFIGTLIYGIYVGEYFHKIRLHVQTTADKLILRGWYNYSKVLKLTSQDLSSAMTLDEINEIVGRDLKEYMDVSKASVLVLR